MSQDVELPQLHDPTEPAPSRPAPVGDLDRLHDVPVQVSVEIGRAKMTVGDALALREGSVITLERMADEAVDVLVNGTPIGRGEVVVIDEQFGLRLTHVLGHRESDGEPAAAEEQPQP